MRFLPGALGSLATTLGAGLLGASLLGTRAGEGIAALALGALLLAADRRL